MQKGSEAFRSIGEVASLIGVAPHVLRYWETQFSLLKPMKRPDGRRYYRPADVRLAAGLCELLRDDGMTIRGAQKLLARDKGEALRLRGAQRLGESDVDADDLASDGEPGHVTSDRNGSEAVMDTPPDPYGDDPDDTLATAETAHAPRSRYRHRHHGDAALAQPSLSAGAPGASDGWLAQAARLAAVLRETSQDHPRWPAASVQAQALRAAIASCF